jgi:hypothetical protein
MKKQAREGNLNSQTPHLHRQGRPVDVAKLDSTPSAVLARVLGLLVLLPLHCVTLEANVIEGEEISSSSQSMSASSSPAHESQRGKACLRPYIHRRSAGSSLRGSSAHGTRRGRTHKKERTEGWGGIEHGTGKQMGGERNREEGIELVLTWASHTPPPTSVRIAYV